jgi:hypothetical protein
MHARTLAIALCATVAMSASASPYDDAQPQARADALDPVTRDYYLRELRPAFGSVFQALLNACAGTLLPDTQSSFGMVMTVTPEGRVKQVLWRTASAFTACLEPGIRAASFPPAPKDEFFFGLAGG